jgi:hypothetical protein
MEKYYHKFGQVESSNWFFPILVKIEMWRQIIKIPNMKLYENPSGWSRAVLCELMDGYDEASSHILLSGSA